MHIRVPAVALAFACLAACGSKETSPAGPVGQRMNFRSKLKSDVMRRAPEDPQATQRELTTELHGVATKLVWRTFDDGPNHYILSAQWEVVSPRSGITIRPVNTTDWLPTNAGTPAAVNEQLIMRISWQDQSASCSTSNGDASFEVRADGAWKKL